MRKVAIIEDDPLEMLVLKGLIDEFGEFGCEVVAEGSDGLEAIEICRTHRPDIVFMDVKMPGKDGIEAAAEISRLCPTPVVILTARDDEETVRGAAEAGAMAYLVKPVRGEELLPAIELAISRFSEFRKLREENFDLKNTLEARKVIDKAKGLLMDKEGLTEGEAFSRIQRTSMDRRMPMKEVAESLILSFEGKKRGFKAGGF